MSTARFAFKPDTAARILWHVRPSCNEAGCKDPQCVCSLCGEPIGTPDDDPRWVKHEEDCDDCDVCRDSIPMMIFRGEGRSMQRAQFHGRCFGSIIDVK
jgi:hypothetical protein